MTIPAGLVSTLLCAQTLISKAIDILFSSVPLLVNGENANANSTSNTVTDIGANAIPLTSSGKATVSSFTPFGDGYWSGQFGASDYVSVNGSPALSRILAGYSNTIEMWVNPSSTVSTNSYVTGVFGASSASASTGKWNISIVGSATSTFNVRFTWATGATTETFVQSTASGVFGKWTHIAVVIDATTATSSTITIYVDGVGLTFTGKDLSYQTTSASYVIAGGMAATVNKFIGYISNLRYVGRSDVYINNFSAPTSPLTVVTSTLFLTLCYNRIRHITYPLTYTGSPSAVSFNPFVPGVERSSTNFGSSICVNPTGISNYDWVTAPNYSTIGVGTGDFTIEFWFYTTLYSKSYSFIVDLRNPNNIGTSQAKPTIYMRSGSLRYYSSGTDRITYATTISNNQWYHVAVVRSGGTTKMYVDGVAATVGFTDPTDYGLTSDLTIGQAGDIRTTANDGLFQGYVSNLRIVKGTAIYTSNFNSPKIPLTNIPNTQLLISSLANNTYDATGNNTLVSYGNAKISTSVTKFGTGSLSFDGASTSYFKGAVSMQALTLGAGNFTVEGWMYMNTLPAVNNHAPLAGVFGANGNMSWLASVYLTGSQTSMRFTYSTDGTTSTIITKSANVTVNANTWYHLAFVRDGSNFYIFLNGTLVSTALTVAVGTTIFVGTQPIEIGATTGYNTFSFLNGYVDDLRITKTARYTSSFTLPTESLPVQ